MIQKKTQDRISGNGAKWAGGKGGDKKKNAALTDCALNKTGIGL